MGCRLSKSYLTIIESPSTSGMNDQTIELVKDTHELVYFLKDENHFGYKCIFIFGGYGSNKGEFIFDLLHEDLKRGEKIKDTFGWRYIYLDVEELIIKNIKTRVKQLTGSLDEENDQDERDVGKQNEEKEAEDINNNQSGDTVLSNDQMNEIQNDQKIISQGTEAVDHQSPLINESTDRTDKQQSTVNSTKIDGRWDDAGFLKKYFGELANVITNNWVRSLIEKEIISFDTDYPKSKFIINLVPNRINLFRDCLYLKQGPNFTNFDCDFVAVNLIRADQTRKDLDLVFDFHSYEDVSDYFVEYFRSINKLIEVKIESKKKEPRLKISRSPTAVKIRNKNQLEHLIKCKPINETLEINISEFTDTLDRKGSLVFLIDNQIDTGTEIIAIDSSETDVRAIRNFVHFYCQIKESLDL